ncbi:hypothetical protein NLJ89_g11095 [Agrocybe chaxingu]|uniref:Uncharacterized protein n=1 Tax=Agrocybe chaxingu TaxID=84603 RepID=A0A9W8MRH1_9AGAR|nr:hypothetical protein NLJ89_g11095 [Agrocybe chaxingu]
MPLLLPYLPALRLKFVSFLSEYAALVSADVEVTILKAASERIEQWSLFGKDGTTDGEQPWHGPDSSAPDFPSHQLSTNHLQTLFTKYSAFEVPSSVSTQSSISSSSSSSEVIPTEGHEASVEPLYSLFSKRGGHPGVDGVEACVCLLLDAVYLADAGLYYRYFPESDSPPFDSVPLPLSSGRTDVHYLGQAPASHLTALPPIMATSTSYVSSSDPYAHSGLNSAYLPVQPHVEPSPSRRSQSRTSYMQQFPAYTEASPPAHHQQLPQLPTPYASYGPYPPACPDIILLGCQLPLLLLGKEIETGTRNGIEIEAEAENKSVANELMSTLGKENGPTASNHPPMPPPLPPLQSSMAAPPMSLHAAGGLTPTHTANNGSMLPPPPTSAASTSSNGTVIPSIGARSSHSRRRSDVSNSNGYGGFVPTSSHVDLGRLLVCPLHLRRVSLGGPSFLTSCLLAWPAGLDGAVERVRGSRRGAARNGRRFGRGFETTRTSRNGSQTPTARGASANGVGVSVASSTRTSMPSSATPSRNGRGVPVQAEIRPQEEMQHQ